MHLGKKPETAVTCLQLLNLINSPGAFLSEKILFLETKLLLMQNPYVAYPAAIKLVKKHPESSLTNFYLQKCTKQRKTRMLRIEPRKIFCSNDLLKIGVKFCQQKTRAVKC